MAKKSPYKFVIFSEIKGALRRAFSKSPVLKQALDKVRKEEPWIKKDGTKALKPRVTYKCADCGKYYGRTKVQCDHKIPVMPLEGALGKDFNWQDVIDRLFVQDASELQILCKGCHSEKTNEENAERRQAKAIREGKVPDQKQKPTKRRPRKTPVRNRNK